MNRAEVIRRAEAMLLPQIRGPDCVRSSQSPLRVLRMRRTPLLGQLFPVARSVTNSGHKARNGCAAVGLSHV